MSISDSPCEKGFLLPMALRQCTISHCPDRQSQEKGICGQVPQAITDPHSPKVPFSPLQWEVSCFISCCQYLFCQSRTLCLVVQGLEGPKCAMSLSLNASALCQQNHSPLSRCRAASLLGWPLVTWVLLVTAVLRTHCTYPVKEMVRASMYNVQHSNKVG